VVVKIEETKFDTCVSQYGRLIFTICLRFTQDYFAAEDLTQDTFLAAYRGLSSFDGGNLKAWLVKIAANKCRDHLKSAARRIQPTDDSELAAAARAEGPETEIIERDTEERLLRACSRLKEPYATVARQYFCERIPIAEICGTGQNLRTVQTQVYRAKMMLRTVWKEEFS